MKNCLIAVILAMFAVGASAEPGGFTPSGNPEYSQGGFKGPTPSLTTVAQAKSMSDDAWVILEGTLVRQVGHELYEFHDGSGSIYVDIDGKRWMGQTVTPNQKVRIEGEVDKDWKRVEIDVKSIHLLK